MKSQNNAWRQSRVYHGKKQGRLLGFPTLNLDPLVLPKDQKEGVYAAIVKLKGKTYKAALFFGPRIVVGETYNTLELYVFDFSDEIYDKKIEFQILDFIRGVMDFSSFEELKKQIKKDVEKIQSLI
ncbi:MAG: riboflavin kinase [Candidatus Levyibacteriota bacterium]|nr:MAG: riboflavin kinase [Candidatus Levybacteria bacterium]